MKNLELSDAETATLIDLLKRSIVVDRYPVSLRVRALVGILGKLSPEPAEKPLPPSLKTYEPPSKGRYRRRG